MNKPTNTFRKFYFSLPADKLEDFKTHVCNVCGFSVATFYHRLRESYYLFSPAEKIAIANFKEIPGLTVQQIFGQDLALKTA